MISKTHSKNIQVSINTGRHKSIGIDLEFIRYRNPNLIKVIKNKNDILDDLSVLEMWVIKEAVFKAISNINSNITFLNQSVVDFKNHKFKFNDIEGNFSITKNNKCCLAIAYI